MKLRLKFTVDKNNLKTQVLFVAEEVIAEIIKNKSPMIIEMAKSLIREEFYDSPVVPSLLEGKLKADFGLSDEMAYSAVDEILDHLVNNISILSVPLKKGGISLASFKLRLSPDPDFYKNIASGSYESNGFYVRSRGADGSVDWLEWLLTRGTEMIIDDYYVWYTTEKVKSKSRQIASTFSRSGMALMLPNTKLRKRSGGFRVDPDFSGTIDDNFITDILQNIIIKLQAYISENLL